MATPNKSHLTANTLFHYTKKLEYLLGILTNEFFPRYCLEEGLGLTLGNKSLKLALPMVCFCDIPLSQIEQHSTTYGSYAIGLSKEWGVKNRINPVMYCYEESASTKNISNLIKKYAESDGNNPNDLKDSDVFPFLFYIKPYIGSLWKNGKVKESNVIFYNEKEWRYVPYIVDQDGDLDATKQ